MTCSFKAVLVHIFTVCLLIFSPTDFFSCFPFSFSCAISPILLLQSTEFPPVSSEDIWTQDGLKSFMGGYESTDVFGKLTVKALILVNKKIVAFPVTREVASECLH